MNRLKLLPCELTCLIFSFLDNGQENKTNLQNVSHEIIQLHKQKEVKQYFAKYKNCYVDYDECFIYLNYYFANQIHYHRFLMIKFEEIPNLEKITKNLEPFHRHTVESYLDDMYRHLGSFNFVKQQFKSMGGAHLHRLILRSDKANKTFQIKMNNDDYIIHCKFPIKKSLLK